MKDMLAKRDKRSHLIWMFALLILVIIAFAPTGGIAVRKHASLPNQDGSDSYAGAPAQSSQELQNGPAMRGPVIGQVTVRQSVKNDESPPLRDIAPLLPKEGAEAPENENEPPPNLPKGQAHVKDPVMQDWFSPLVMPTPIVN